MNPEVQMNGKKLLALKNIPRCIRSAHLRKCFRRNIENNHFDCFHFKHRPQAENHEFCVAFALIYEEHCRQFQQDYDGCSWKIIFEQSSDDIDRFDFDANLKLRVTILQDKDYSRAKLLPELNPPKTLPNGNVGTSTSILKSMISKCVLPARVVGKLKIDFVRNRNRRYGEVQMSYDGHQFTRKNKLQSDSHTMTKVQMNEPNFKKPKRAESSPGSRHVDRNYDDDDHIEYEDGNDNDDNDDNDELPEEWDRHLSYYPEDSLANQDRAKERLYEKNVEHVWDKGDASGLVTYTDAFYWNEQEGSFEDRTADNFDISSDIYDGAGPGDNDTQDLYKMHFSKSSSHQYAGKGRNHDTEALDIPHIQNFGQKVLEQYGWQPGKSVGKKKNGITRPIEAQGQGPRDRFGIGFRPSMIKKDKLIQRQLKKKAHR